MELTKVGTQSMVALIVGAVLSVILPAALALIWKFKKKERFTTILLGAATFMVFVLVLEKPIQNVLIFPAQMGLPEHALARAITASPILLSFLAALFPGVFEETGRLVMFKTVLKDRTNRETSVSFGIGHGGFEVIMILGMSFVGYIVYAVMINTGAFGAVIDQITEQAPDQIESVYALAEQIATFTFADLGLMLAERLAALLFHIAASVLVFYACRDKGKGWLYPLAVILHTAMDFFAALYLFELIVISPLIFECIVAVFGILVFLGAYLLLYRKDKEKGAVNG